MARPPVTRSNGVKRMTATATVLALAGGVAAVPLGPLGPLDVAHAQVAPTQQPGISHGTVQTAGRDWEASVFFLTGMTVRTVSIDFVPADSTNPREEAPLGDPVFTRIPEVADYRLDHMRGTQVLASYNVKAYRTQGTSTSGHPTIRITYELPGVEVGPNERLALFAPGMGTTYPTPLRGGGSRFTRPTVNADIRGAVTIHDATEDEYTQTQVEIRQGAETFSSPVQADGSYNIAMTSPSGTMEISVIPPAGFVAPEPKTWQAAEGLAAPDFEVYPITVSGKLIDASGVPVQGATVTVGGRSAVSDANGNFTVTKVPAGTRDVVIGDTERTRGKTVPGVSVSDQRDNRIEDITVETKPQFGTVSGRVTGPSGSGIPGVTVTIGGKSAYSNSDGSFAVEGVPTGNQSIVVSGEPAGYEVVAPSSVDVRPDGSTSPVNVTLVAQPSSVSGRVNGLPAGASVTVIIGGKTATVNSDGSFVAVDVPAGVQPVVVSGVPAGYSVVAPASVEVEPDGSTSPVEVVLSPNPSSVSGRVNGLPTGAAVTVTIGGRPAAVNPDGSFVAVDVPAGVQPVKISGVPAGYTVIAPGSVDVKPDGSTSALDVTITPPPAPTTRTTTSTTVTPSAPTPTTKTTTLTTRTTTSTTSTTTTPKPTPTTPTSTTKTTTSTTPAPKPSTTTPPTPRVGSVVGAVVDTAGNPVQGATVIATDSRGTKRSVHVDRNGRVQIDNLPPGDYTVEVDTPTGYHDLPSTSVTVKVGETTELPGLILTPVQPARFNWDRVVVKPGETKVTAPTRSGDISAAPRFRTSGVTRVEPDGTTTEIPTAESWISVEGDGTVVARPPRNAAPGEYRVEVADEAGQTHIITVEVANPTPMSEQYAVRFPVIPVPAGATRQAGRPRATVTDGPFTYADRRLPEGTRFAVDPKHSGWVRVDGNGRLTFTPPLDAAPGTRPVAVTVTFPDGSSRTYTAEVEIGEPLLAGITELGYEDGLSVRPGEAVTVLRTGANPLPAGTTFEVDRSEPLGGWVAVVDEHTGNLRVFAPSQGPARVEVPVVAYFADGSSSKLTAGVRLSTSSALSTAHNPSYPATTGAPGSSVDVKLSGTVPADTTFVVVDGGGLRSVGVDRQKGSLRIALPADAQLDTPYTVTVRVRYADGSTEEITASVTATSDAARYMPGVTGATAEVGGAVVVRTGLPAGAKLVDFNHDGWKVRYNAETGELTVEPSVSVPVGTVLKVPLEVTFPDGSKKIVEYPVTATGKQDPAPAPERGSSAGGWIAVVVGAIAALAGIGYAAFLNQDAIRAQLKQFGF